MLGHSHVKPFYSYVYAMVFKLRLLLIYAYPTLASFCKLAVNTLNSNFGSIIKPPKHEVPAESVRKIP